MRIGLIPEYTIDIPEDKDGLPMVRTVVDGRTTWVELHDPVLDGQVVTRDSQDGLIARGYLTRTPEMTFRQEWQRIVFQPNGERMERLDSGWYDDERIPRGMLNPEYPEPTPTGWYQRLQTRWVSEHRMVPLPEDAS